MTSDATHHLAIAAHLAVSVLRSRCLSIDANVEARFYTHIKSKLLETLNNEIATLERQCQQG